MGWPKVQSRFDKTESFTVPADREQADRWQAAASLERRDVGSWLAETADLQLRERARIGAKPALSWSRDYFRVAFVEGEQEVRGIAAGPFGVFRGDAHGLGEPGSGSHSLIHRPTGRIVKTLSLRKSCMALAAELSALRVNWQETNPDTVIRDAPDRESAQRLIRLFETI